MHDVVGKRMLEFVSEIEEHWLDNYGKVAVTGVPVRFTGEYKGLNRFFEVYAFHLGDAFSRRVAVLFTDITSRKQAADALAISEERYRVLTELSPQFVFMSTPDGSITYVNQYGQDFLGKRLEELLGDGWSRSIHPDAQHAELRKWRAAALNKTDYESDVPLLHRDGTYRTVYARAQQMVGEDGQVLYWIGTALDIEDRKQAQEKLRANENQLRLITDAIPALVSYIDDEERYQFVNRQYSEWFGLPPEEFIGKKLGDLLGEGAYAAIEPHVMEALAGQEISFDGWIDYEVAGRRFVHVSYVPDKAPDGRVVGFYALVSDLSDLQKSTDLLRSSQERMRLLTESFTDYAIFSTDNDGMIESWNPGAQNIYGYNESEIVGSSYEMLFTPEDVSKAVPIKEMRFSHEAGRASDERWQVRKDGTRFFASGTMVPLYVGPDLAGYAKIASDLTERKRNAEALQRAHDEMEMRVLDRTRELAEANAALTAEINERKAAEEQKIELLKRLVTSQEDERQRIARDLHDQLGQRLTALRLKIASLREVVGKDKELQSRTTRLQEIAQLLDSEVSFLAWELRPSAIEEFGVVDAIATFVHEWSRHYGIDAEFQSAGMARFQLDKDADTHLYRIAQEALNNIVKHAKATKVNVIVERTGKDVILIVEDDGVGFDKNDASQRRKSGKGLGLTGMSERASLINGQTEIESSPGRGTTIFVRVPVEKSDLNGNI
ncbi:MAG: PAS domain S-box protein, partial [Pyrinomonadaceae bacterium]